MALRSVIDVDVNDASFREFQKLFEKYQGAVGRLPGAWGQVNRAQAQSKNTFVDIASAMMTQAEMLRRNTREAENFDRTLSRTRRTMQGLSRETREFSGHLMTATGTLMKWTGITGVIGSLVGLMSGAGVVRLASSASGNYRSAMGFAGPTTPGQVGAAGAYGGILNPRQALGQLTEMLTTGEGKRGLVSLGLGPESWNKGAGALLPEFLQRLQGLAKRTPLGNFGDVMGGYGLGGFTEQAMILKRMSPQELNELTQMRVKNERELNALTEKILFKWAKLDATLDLASTKIQSAFIVGLESLTPEIARLVDAFSNAVLHFLTSKRVKDWVEMFSEKLEHIDIDEFGKRIEQVATKLVQLATAAGKFISWLTEWATTLDKDHAPGPQTDKQRSWESYKQTWQENHARGTDPRNQHEAARDWSHGYDKGEAKPAQPGPAPEKPAQWGTRLFEWLGFPKMRWPGQGASTPGTGSGGAAGTGTGVEGLLNDIRGRESVGAARKLGISPYELRPEHNMYYPRSHASGAYQFQPATWRAASEAAGIGTEYDEAYKAPSNIQDAVARHFATHNDPNSLYAWKASAPPGGYKIRDTATQIAEKLGGVSPAAAATRAPGASLPPAPSGAQTAEKLVGVSPAAAATRAPGASLPPAPSGALSEAQKKEVLGRYTPAELEAYRSRGMFDSRGIPTMPPGTPINSRGLPYNPERMTSQQERNNAAASSAWGAATRRGDRSFFAGQEAAVSVQRPSGVRVKVEYDTGGSAVASGAQVAQ